MKHRTVKIPGFKLDEVPEQGEYVWVGDSEWLVVRSNVINNSMVELLVSPKRETKYYDDPEDFPSLEMDNYFFGGCEVEGVVHTK